MSTSSSTEPLIAARGLAAGYGSGDAIRDVNLEVYPGEVVALLGPNGAGKSTTLLALAGELRPTQGEVMWSGSTRHAPLHRRAREGMAFVPEDTAVFGGLSTSQNLAVARYTDAEAALDLFPHLRTMLSRRANLLSGGEQRALAVARAVSGSTKLLLADELSLGLAPRSAATILQAIRRAADAGLGALLVEQHVHKVLKVADRVYVMRRGRINLSATAAEAAGQIDEIRSEYLSGDSADPVVEGS